MSMSFEEVIELAKSKALPSVELAYKAGQPATLLGSKLGGLAPWPKGAEYPVDAAGAMLHLLAQINFADRPDRI